MKAFVTATGTDIGKTYVTCGLLRALIAAGNQTWACKPVVSGFDPENFAQSDPAQLLRAQYRPANLPAIAAISPWRFAAPRAPDEAARLEQRAIPFADLLAFCRHAGDDPARSVLIEGIGGVMVPLDETHTVLDLMAELRLPAILVAGSYLGTLSHTLTALAALRARAIRCVVVISASGAIAEANQAAEVIVQHGRQPVQVLARGPSPHEPAVFGAILRAAATL